MKCPHCAAVGNHTEKLHDWICGDCGASWAGVFGPVTRFPARLREPPVAFAFVVRCTACNAMAPISEED